MLIQKIPAAGRAHSIAINPKIHQLRRQGEPCLRCFVEWHEILLALADSPITGVREWQDVILASFRRIGIAALSPSTTGG